MIGVLGIIDGLVWPNEPRKTKCHTTGLNALRKQITSFEGWY
jgi:hypothetical protein